MAKKRRVRRIAAGSARTTPERTARPARPTAAEQTPVAPPVSRGAEVDFASEYHYVLGDLKRIGVLAVAMFATLIALALILQ